MTFDDAHSGLPDPVLQPEFYNDVPTKRLIAWFCDIVLVFLLSVLLALSTFGLAFFVFAPLFLVVGFLYRWITLTARSATLGMRLTAIELRTDDGDRLAGGTAFLHVLGYYISMGAFILQVISITLMLTSPRKQGLTDHLLGTAALNLTARR